MSKEDSRKEPAEALTTSGQQNVKLEPPDGGWGWMIILGTSISLMVVPTTLSGYGVLIPALMQEFDATVALASVVPAIGGAVFNLTGPYASALLAIYSHRRLALIGTLISFLAVAFSSVVPSMQILFITYGLMLGLGVGLCSSMGILMTQEYFVAKRPLANGITMAGGSVGQMAVPLLIQYLLNTYGLRGALLILSAIVLQGVIAAALFQPSRWHWKLADAQRVVVEQQAVGQSENGYQSVRQSEKPNDVEAQKSNQRSDSISIYEEVECPATTTELSFMAQMGSLASIPPPEVFQTVQNSPQSMTLHQLRQQRKVHHLFPQRRWWLQWIPRCPDPKTILDWALFKDGFFWIFSLTLALARLTYQEFNVLIPSFAVSMDIDPTSAASLVTILASADTAARLFIPVISNWVIRWLSRTQVYLIGFILCMIGSFVTAFSTNFGGLVTGCVVYGIGIGGLTALSVVILVEHYGLQRLASAYGLNIFFSGVFIFPGILLIGYVQGITQSFPICFHIIGGLCVACGVLWSFLPCVLRRAKTKTNHQATSS